MSVYDMLPAGQQVSKEGLSAMGSLKVHLNRQIAKILGDLQDSKQEPLEDPSPTRAGCRIFFVASLLLGFSMLLVYNFIDAPDARVVQMHHLIPGEKNHAFPSCFLYDRSSPKCSKWSSANFPPGVPVSCPCTNTSAPWKNFVKFYILHENSKAWNMGFTTESSPESVLSRRLALDMAVSVNTGNEDLRRFYNALAHLLTGLLDRDEKDSRESYIYGAYDLSRTLSASQTYDRNALVWYLGDDLGPIFLHPQIDWEAYRQTCSPEYCEVIEPMRGAWKLYWAFGILGGVATIVLAVVTTVLWPCTAMLLLWASKRNASATADPERPKGPLLHNPGL